MNYSIFTDWFTPYVKQNQINKTKEICKNYNNTSIFGITRSNEQVFENSMTGEAIEYHIVNVLSLLGENIFHTNDFTDIKYDNKIVECKSFKDFTNVCQIIDHFVEVDNKQSDYIYMFHRNGIWNGGLKYRLFFVFNIKEIKFEFINNCYNNYKDIIDYIKYKFERSK